MSTLSKVRYVSTNNEKERYVKIIQIVEKNFQLHHYMFNVICNSNKMMYIIFSFILGANT